MKNILYTLLTSMILFGQVSTQVGTTSGNFILIPVFAKSISMGNTGVSTASGVEALYYNPAGIVGETSEAAVSMQDHIADIKTNFFGAVFNFENSAIGFSMKTMDNGKLEQTTFDNPEGVGLASFDVDMVVAGLTYAQRFTDRVSAGITLNVINESVLNISATAVSLDAGIRYNFDENATLGLALKNVGSKLEFTGEALYQDQQSSGADPNAASSKFSAALAPANIPATFEMGLSYKSTLDEDSYVRSQTTLNINNSGENQFALGAEYGFQFLSVRAGYDFSSSWIDEYLRDFSFGLGVNTELSGSSVLSLDYAYVNMADYFDGLNMFTVKLSF